MLAATSENLIGNYKKYVDKDGGRYADGTKNVVKEGTYYSYVIVPKYDKKREATNLYNTYNLDKHSDPASGRATLANAQIKNFTATNYGVTRIRTKWTKLKGASAYLLLRTTSNPKYVEEKDWKDVKWWVFEENSSTPAYQTAFNKCQYIDGTAVVGQTYYYVICAGSERSGTSSKDSIKAAKSVPLAPTSLKIEEGDSFTTGAKITFTTDGRDNGYGVKYILQQSTDGGNWVTLGTYKNGTTVQDPTELVRGSLRKYRVITYYEPTNTYGGARASGTGYSKPTSISIKCSNSTLAVGDTATVTIYPIRTGDEVAMYKQINITGITGGALEKVSEKYEGNHKVVVVKAVRKGYGQLTAEANGSNWASGSSKASDLKKTITITVR